MRKWKKLLALVCAGAIAAAAFPFSVAYAETAGESVTRLETDFEGEYGDSGNIEGLTAREGAVLSVTDGEAYSGEQSLLVSGRTNNSAGFCFDLSEVSAIGDTFEIELAVQSPIDTNVGVGLEVVYTDGEDGEEQSKELYLPDEISGQYLVPVEAGEWTQIIAGKAVTLENFSEAADPRILSIGAIVTTKNADPVPENLWVDDLAVRTTAAITGDEFDRSLTPLYTAYEGYFTLGNIYETGDIGAELCAHHFNAVSPGNMLKPDRLQPEEGVFQFAAADAAVSMFNDAGIPIHGHTFCWWKSYPDWMVYEGLGREKALDNLRTHITTVMQHYKGKIGVWDVVNEAIEDGSFPDWRSGLRKSDWYNEIGDDFVYEAFLAARKADPDAVLYYNDYWLEKEAKADLVIEMVKELNARYQEETGDDRLLIEGVGLQGHDTTETDVADVRRTLEKLRELGVRVSITEMDIAVFPVEETLSKENEIRQAQKWAELMILYKEFSDMIENVTLWGDNDGTSWRKGYFACPFDANLQAKEAYWAILDPEGYLEEHPIEEPPDEEPSEVRRAAAQYGTPAVDGEEDPVWQDAEEYEINRYLTATNGATAKIRLLWDEDYLYLYAGVTDPVLSDKGLEPHEQDSVEIFIGEHNWKGNRYSEGDAQYRVSYKNEASFGTSGCDTENFRHAVKMTAGGYVVEVAVPLQYIEPAGGEILGFDFQVNDDTTGNGARTSMAVFWDDTGDSWQYTGNWGEVILKKEAEEPRTEAEKQNPPYIPPAKPEKDETESTDSDTEDRPVRIRYWSRDGKGEWVQLEDGTWNLLIDGKTASGWQKVDNTWYYFDGSGKMATGWQFMNGTWYYLKDWGGMATGWLLADGAWYYLDSSGAMLADTCTPDGYYVNQNGQLQNIA